jgi:HPr kinase/phosphorylase
MTVKDLLENKGEELQLTLVAGQGGLERKVEEATINRPGLALAGYLKYFAYKRIQVLGKLEISYLEQLSQKEKERVLESLFQYPLCCIIITWAQDPPPILLKYGDEHKVAVFKTPLPTPKIISLLTKHLEEEFSPQTSVHGDLLDVHGVGVLILGESGVGKSECALELVEKGHRLVADDVVNIKRRGNTLIGSSPELIKHHMEIRGVGVINIKQLFGASAICESKEINLVVRLEEWDASKEYDRLGLENPTACILDVEVPQASIPVRPGRDIAVIIEVAAMNHRLKQMGYHAAEEFSKELVEWIKKARR